MIKNNERKGDRRHPLEPIWITHDLKKDPDDYIKVFERERYDQIKTLVIMNDSDTWIRYSFKRNPEDEYDRLGTRGNRIFYGKSIPKRIWASREFEDKIATIKFGIFQDEVVINQESAQIQPRANIVEYDIVKEEGLVLSEPLGDDSAVIISANSVDNEPFSINVGWIDHDNNIYITETAEDLNMKDEVQVWSKLVAKTVRARITVTNESPEPNNRINISVITTPS